MDNWVGKNIDKYTILEAIGTGNRGDVYKARHKLLDKIVAIKLLNVKTISDEQEKEMITRFVREGRANAKLNHPNIVPIRDVGEENGIYYIIMDYIRGETLATLLERENKLPTSKALSIIKSIAEGLHEAHKKHIIHRDIKPSNIMITPEEKVIITDFGMAKEIDNEAEAGLTQVGKVYGTPSYMPPEQALGTIIDGRVDLYSLGILFYRCVTGELPYEGSNSFHVIQNHINSPIPKIKTKLPKFPKTLESMYEKLVAKKPEDRFQSTEELLNKIEQYQSLLGTRSIKRKKKISEEIKLPPMEKTHLEVTLTEENNIELEGFELKKDLLAPESQEKKKFTKKYIPGKKAEEEVPPQTSEDPFVLKLSPLLDNEEKDARREEDLQNIFHEFEEMENITVKSQAEQEITDAFAKFEVSEKQEIKSQTEQEVTDAFAKFEVGEKEVSPKEDTNTLKDENIKLQKGTARLAQPITNRNTAKVQKVQQNDNKQLVNNFQFKPPQEEGGVIFDQKPSQFKKKAMRVLDNLKDTITISRESLKLPKNRRKVQFISLFIVILTVASVYAGIKFRQKQYNKQRNTIQKNLSQYFKKTEFDKAELYLFREKEFLSPQHYKTFSTQIQNERNTHKLKVLGTNGWFNEKMPKWMQRNSKKGSYIWEKDKSFMVFVPKGYFLRGSDSYKKDERPQKKIWISSYYIDKYELSFGKYEVFCKKTGHPLPYKLSPKKPITSINWYDARLYARWAKKRLPTEAQWEKAAKGGYRIPNWKSKSIHIKLKNNPFKTRTYPWGEEPPRYLKSLRCNYQVNIKKKNSTTDIGSYTKGESPYRCSNMAGNVKEWCYDRYHSKYYRAKTKKDPRGPRKGSYRVCKGGAFDSSAKDLYITRRGYFIPQIRYNNIGVRFVVPAK